MSRLPSLLCALACALLLAACGEDEPETKAASPTPTATGTPTAEPTPAAQDAECKDVKEPKAKPDGKLSKPKLKLDKAKTYTATVETSCGSFEIALDDDENPKTVASFVSLARKGFFKDTIFHRIVPGFVIQGGDPTGTGMGGPGYSVEEAPPEDTTYDKGVVAMAKTGVEAPGTSGSQFYVVSGDASQLPAEYAVLGKVSGGEEVVDAIAAQPVGPDERPTSPVVIESVKVAES